MKWLFYISVLFLSVFGYNQDSLSSFISRDSIRIGDPILLTIEYYHQSVNDSIEWPLIPDTLNTDVEVLDRSQRVKSASNIPTYPHVQKQQFQLTSFKPGIQIIKPFVFKHDTNTLKTDYHSFQVKLVEVDTTQGIYDIAPIYDVDYSFKDEVSDFFKNNWYWFIAILALTVLIVLVWIFKKPKEKELEAEPIVIIPAHIKALNIFNQLIKEEAWQNEDKKLYYSLLSDTLREYLESRFQILALEKTTREIIEDLKYADISPDDKYFLKEILRQSDFVKFAKFKPSDTDAKTAIEKSVKFVNLTKQIDNTDIKQDVE